MATLAEIWRHPIKALGREMIESASLNAGQTLPGDRIWAVAHEASKAKDAEWARCTNFIRAAGSPMLMAITIETVGPDHFRLSHPDRPDLVVSLPQDAGTVVAWAAPLVPEERAQPVAVIQAPQDRGFTDTSGPSISLGNFASHRAVSQRLGQDLSHHRWRANLWIEGLAPWEEFDLIDKTIRIGTAEFEVYKRIERCPATQANPETGRRDADTLCALETWGHQDFTVGLKVIRNGDITRGDRLEVLK
jgi:uncharacterized protein YcbX